MSRHRAVRNLDIDDVLEEDDYAVDYEENELDEMDLSEKDRVELAEGLAHVLSVIGNEDIPVSDMEIKEALWYYYFDREETIQWVIEKIAERKAEEEKQKKKAAKKAAKDRKPRYRRPPSKLYPDVLWKEQQQREKKPTTSLAQLSQRPRTSALQNLANRNNPTTTSTSSLSGLAKKNNNETTKKSTTPSSLQSLAQKSIGQRGKSALQNLASRQQQQQTNQDKSSSLTGLAKLSTDNNKTGGLTHLATRTTTTTMKSSPQINKLSSLSGLVKKQPLKQEQSFVQPKQEQKLIEKTEELQTTTPIQQKEQSKRSIPMITTTTTTTNPLCASPSTAASFLFKRNSNQEKMENINILYNLPNSVGQAFYEAMKKASDENIHLFSFNDPSPDDIVLEAQSQRSGGRKL